jgi:hypothetical protein
MEIRLNNFAGEGQAVNDEWRLEYSPFLTGTFEYLSVVFATSLLWTHHAHNLRAYLDYAVPFMESKKSVDQNQVRLHMGQHGEDALAISLTNLRVLRNELKKGRIPDFKTCPAKDIWFFQNRMIRVINQGCINGTLTGIGPWLTYGPSKIILCFESRLWGDPDAETIILSTGMEVIRGVRILVNEGFIDASILPFLEDDLAQNPIIHREFQKLARIVGSTAMHINTATHMLGRGDISI